MENQFTLQELYKLESFANTSMHKLDLELRKIRRNRELIQGRYDSTPKKVIIENCILSPDEQIESIKLSKQEVKTIKLKIRRNINQLRALTSQGKVEG